MNKTINQYINQLHLDPKREAAVRKLVESVEESPQIDKLVEALTIKPKYEFVDLGLPSGIKWATCNIGANSPEEFGLYFAWGETQGYEGITNEKQFSWTDYKLCGGSDTTLTKYNNNSSYGTVDTLTTLELSDDAAYQSDNTCRMPTKAEIEELTANTTSKWETLNGVNGRRFTSTNGNSIFVPAAGGCSSGSVNIVGSYGCLWSSSLYESNPRGGWGLYFYSDDVNVGNYDYRYNGLTVRAVQDPNVTSGTKLFNPADYVTKTELDETIITKGDGNKYLADNGTYKEIPEPIYDAGYYIIGGESNSNTLYLKRASTNNIPYNYDANVINIKLDNGGTNTITFRRFYLNEYFTNAYIYKTSLPKRILVGNLILSNLSNDFGEYVPIIAQYNSGIFQCIIDTQYNNIPQFKNINNSAIISNITNINKLSIITASGTLGFNESVITQFVNTNKSYKFTLAVIAESEDITITIPTDSIFILSDPSNNVITVPTGGGTIIECIGYNGRVLVKW